MVCFGLPVQGLAFLQGEKFGHGNDEHPNRHLRVRTACLCTKKWVDENTHGQRAASPALLLELRYKSQYESS